MSDDCTITITDEDDWLDWYNSDGDKRGMPEPEKTKDVPGKCVPLGGGGKKRRKPTKRRRPTKGRRPTKRRRATKRRRPTKRRR